MGIRGRNHVFSMCISCQAARALPDPEGCIKIRMGASKYYAETPPKDRICVMEPKRTALTADTQGCTYVVTECRNYRPGPEALALAQQAGGKKRKSGPAKGFTRPHMSPQDLELIRIMRTDGASYDAIARELGRPKATIRKACKRLGYDKGAGAKA